MRSTVAIAAVMAIATSVTGMAIPNPSTLASMTLAAQSAMVAAPPVPSVPSADGIFAESDENTTYTPSVVSSTPVVAEVKAEKTGGALKNTAKIGFAFGVAAIVALL